jgi:hypothetical protein
MRSVSAKLVADHFADRSDNITHCAVYDDGIILYLAVSDATTHRWIDRLRATECARSEDGLIWSIILRGNPEMEQTRAFFAGEKIHGDGWREATWQDNRRKDDNTIDRFLTLLKRIKEGDGRTL